ncbi:hypothetical protein ACFX14_005924 [Malus domestica]
MSSPTHSLLLHLPDPPSPSPPFSFPRDPLFPLHLPDPPSLSLIHSLHLPSLHSPHINLHITLIPKILLAPILNIGLSCHRMTQFRAAIVWNRRSERKFDGVLSQVSRISTAKSASTLELLMKREFWASEGMRQVEACERVTGGRDVAVGGNEEVMGFVWPSPSSLKSEQKLLADIGGWGERHHLEEEIEARV